MVTPAGTHVLCGVIGCEKHAVMPVLIGNVRVHVCGEHAEILCAAFGGKA